MTLALALYMNSMSQTAEFLCTFCVFFFVDHLSWIKAKPLAYLLQWRQWTHALWEERLFENFPRKKSHLIEIQLKTLSYGIETTEKQKRDKGETDHYIIDSEHEQTMATFLLECERKKIIFLWTHFLILWFCLSFYCLFFKRFFPLPHHFIRLGSLRLSHFLYPYVFVRSSMKTAESTSSNRYKESLYIYKLFLSLYP